jgi:FAD/FMN-containing dehydrogenase
MRRQTFVALVAAAAAAAAAAPFASLPAPPARHAHPYATLASARAAFPPRTAPRAPRAAAAAPPACAPADACWPTPAEWAALNASTGGALVAVAPPLAPCFPFAGAAPDAAACDAALANYSNSYWRAAQPGAMQSPNREQDDATGDDCFDAARPCALGLIPPFAVRAAGAADVAAALAFAAAHALRVVVKATGHEYQGRSTAANALLIWVHGLRGVAFDAALALCGGAPEPAMSAAPGDSWGDVYAAADAAGVTVVGGSEISVSAAGGYTLGGGHSWTGPAYGMAVDNLLRARVVLANGTTVVASRCENADLFWALRGGGGGSFGVLTEATYRAHPVPAGGVAGATIVLATLRGAASLAILFDGWMAHAPALSSPAATGVVAGGYFIVNGPAGSFTILLAFNGTVDQANAALAPLAAWAATVAADVKIASATVAPFASMHAWHTSFDPRSEATGSVSCLASRLIPRAIMADDAARAAMAYNMTEIAMTGVGITGLFVTGGAVAGGDAAATSLTPAWRAAGFHFVFGAGWELNATAAERARVEDGVSGLAQLLRDGAPDSGAYWSESDFSEPNWQAAFWGGNYARLQAVKAAVDPAGVFYCHHCVELPA